MDEGKRKKRRREEVKEYKEATRISNQAEMQVGAKVVSKRGILQKNFCAQLFFFPSAL